jgi:non-ribosomal peptide synthetase component F
VAVTERQQFADFFQAEAQRLGAADEAQPAQVLLAEDAVTPGRACRRRQQLLAFVVAHRIDRHAGLAGQLSNVHGGFLRMLPPL